MTPLAHRITKELTLPVKRRTFDDRAGLLRRMDDVHCFEVSEVVGLARAMQGQMGEHGVDERSTFLPAPKTWVEWSEGRGRYGYLLEEVGDGEVRVTGACDFGQSSFGTWKESPFALTYSPWKGTPTEDLSAFLASGRASQEHFLSVLAIINTPRIIGRRQHMPHRGLERRLTKALGVQGKFPLNAWTEIKLQVGPPKDMSGDGSTEAHLTGQRALHFCRSHLRIRLGRLELVRSHWRGDASLGIKQSRYRMQAPANENSRYPRAA